MRHSQRGSSHLARHVELPKICSAAGALSGDALGQPVVIADSAGANAASETSGVRTHTDMLLLELGDCQKDAEH